MQCRQAKNGRAVRRLEARAKSAPEPWPKRTVSEQPNPLEMNSIKAMLGARSSHTKAGATAQTCRSDETKRVSYCGLRATKVAQITYPRRKRAQADLMMEAVFTETRNPRIMDSRMCRIYGRIAAAARIGKTPFMQRDKYCTKRERNDDPERQIFSNLYFGLGNAEKNGVMCVWASEP
jgi:hypothetical protein